MRMATFAAIDEDLMDSLHRGMVLFFDYVYVERVFVALSTEWRRIAFGDVGLWEGLSFLHMPRIDRIILPIYYDGWWSAFYMGPTMYYGHVSCSGDRGRRPLSRILAVVEGWGRPDDCTEVVETGLPCTEPCRSGYYIWKWIADRYIFICNSRRRPEVVLMDVASGAGAVSWG